MRRRVFRRPKTPRIRVVRFEEASVLVTLEMRSESNLDAARDAFVRIRPKEEIGGEELSRWRESVAKVAKAVRVVPPPKAALVPAASDRSDDIPVGTIREEATRLAEETGNDAVIANVVRILDEVGA